MSSIAERVEAPSEEVVDQREFRRIYYYPVLGKAVVVTHRELQLSSGSSIHYSTEYLTIGGVELVRVINDGGEQRTVLIETSAGHRLAYRAHKFYEMEVKRHALLKKRLLYFPA